MQPGRFLANGIIIIFAIVMVLLTIGALIVLGNLFLGPVFKKIAGQLKKRDENKNLQQTAKEQLQSEQDERLEEEYGQFAWYYKQTDENAKKKR